MDLRLTLQTTVNRALSSTRLQTDALGKLQEQASSGKRINLPEDDPLGSAAVINARAQDTRLDSDLSNIQTARTTLDVGVSTLQSANQIFIKARELAIEGSSSANDQTALNALATEVDALYKQLVEVANTQHNGQYLFAGARTNTVPFATNAAGTVTYQGGDARAELPVSTSQTVSSFYVGSEVFQARQRGTSVYTGSTGAAPGSGTDSTTGQGTLVIAHTATTFGVSQTTSKNSGVAAGTGSAAGDTVLGPAGANVLSLVDTSGTGAGGTVSLNGGPAVAFTSADANLKVTGPGGEIVYLNTQNIAAGFDSGVDGKVPLTATGTAAASGGAAVALNFTGNQTVTDANGGVTNVDTSNVRRAGTTSVSYTGTYDAFQALAALRDDLRNPRGLSGTDQAKTISARLGDLDRARNNILEVVGEQSATLQNLDGLESHAQDVQLSTKKLITDKESADVADIVVKLQSQQNQFRLTLATSAKLFDQSLLDFIK